MKLKESVFIIFALLMLASCNVLTNGQIKNINAFATCANNYTYFPSQVFQKRADLHLNNELLEASQFTDADRIAKRVNSAREHYHAVMQLSDKFDLSLKLLQQYAVLLSKLSSDSYITDLTTSTNDLNDNLSNLVNTYNLTAETKLPVAVGQQISNVILIVGKRITKNRQARELKKFIPAGNSLIKATVNNLVEVLDTDAFVGLDGLKYPSLKALLEKEKNDFVTNYKNVVLANTQQNGNKISYSSIQTYSNTINDFETTEALRQATVIAAKKLARAHETLTREMERRKRMSEIKIEIQDLIADVQQLHKIIKEFRSVNTVSE